MNFITYSTILFTMQHVIPVSWSSRRTKFASIRQHKCAFGGDNFWTGTGQTRRQRPPLGNYPGQPPPGIYPGKSPPMTSPKPKRQGKSPKELMEDLEKNKPDFDLGPKRNRTYDPTVGYEPYWVGGNWVMETGEEPKKKKGPKKEYTICGVPCNPIYLRYGTICGRNRDFVYRTFPNYCAMINLDCTGRWKWLVAYKGPCKKELKTYPTLSQDIISRASKYLAQFSTKHKKMAG